MEEINKLKKFVPDNLYLQTSEGKLGLIMNKGATKWNSKMDRRKYNLNMKEYLEK